MYYLAYHCSQCRMPYRLVIMCSISFENQILFKWKTEKKKIFYLLLIPLKDRYLCSVTVSTWNIKAYVCWIKCWIIWFSGFANDSDPTSKGGTNLSEDLWLRSPERTGMPMPVLNRVWLWLFCWRSALRIIYELYNLLNVWKHSPLLGCRPSLVVYHAIATDTVPALRRGNWYSIFSDFKPTTPLRLVYVRRLNCSQNNWNQILLIKQISSDCQTLSVTAGSTGTTGGAGMP